MSDLISREKLKKEAESLRVTVMGLRSGKGILAEYAKHYRESFLRMIDEQPTVEPVRGEWIPVKERLPEEEYDTVLAVTNAKHYAVYVYTSEHGFRTMDIDAIGEVIAWMPLPEPYKEGSNEEN